MVLLDTHALLWSFLAPGSLSPEATAIFESEEEEIAVSVVSAWEIATKVRRGKLPEAAALESRFEEAVREARYTLLPLEVATALRAGRFAAARGDPFDRMIAAQALALDIPVVSKDAKLDVFGVRRIW